MYAMINNFSAANDGVERDDDFCGNCWLDIPVAMILELRALSHGVTGVTNFDVALNAFGVTTLSDGDRPSVSRGIVDALSGDRLL